MESQQPQEEVVQPVANAADTTDETNSEVVVDPKYTTPAFVSDVPVPEELVSKMPPSLELTEEEKLKLSPAGNPTEADVEEIAKARINRYYASFK